MKKLALLAIVLMATATVAQAAAINPINPRPVPLGPAPGSEWNMQQILNNIWPVGAPVAATDQKVIGMWTGSTSGDVTTIPTLRFEFAGNAPSNEFGIWFGSDTGNIFTKTILFGAAAPGNYASLSISGNTLNVGGYPDLCTGPTTRVNCGEWTDPLITTAAFGFFLGVNNGATKYFSLDQLNGGVARSVAYVKNDTWIMGFEDGTDFDYNDLVVKVESLTGVPEPGSMLLLGTGLFGLAGAVRRRIKK